MSTETEQLAPTPMYPIMDGPSVPWEVMVPHEAMAQSNHSQTLRRLAERGGLGPAEAWAVVSGIKLSGLRGKIDWDGYRESWLKFAAETNARYERRERELATERAAREAAEKELLKYKLGFATQTEERERQEYRAETAKAKLAELQKASLALYDFCLSHISAVQDIPDEVWIPFKEAVNSPRQAIDAAMKP